MNRTLTAARSTLLMAVLIGMLSSIGVPAHGQGEGGGPSARLFGAALAHYRGGRFSEAVSGFGRIVSEYPLSPQVTAALIMKGKALLHLGENLEAARTARRLLTDNPTSRYVADAHLLLGTTYGRVGRHLEEMSEYAAAWERRPDPPSPALDGAILSALDTVIDREMSAAQILDALRFVRDPVLRAYFWVKVGEKESDRENMLGLAVAIDSLSERYPGHPFAVRLKGLEARVAGASRVIVAALVPLMEGDPPSVTREIGREILAGIQHAVDTYSADPRVRTAVSLRIFDAKRDPARVDSIIRSLGAEAGVAAIVGPVFSAPAMTGAVAAQSAGIPMVSPTANANGIAAAGEFAFQANPDYEMRGRAMARYVVRDCGLTQIAVLAPTNGYGKFQADGFLREARLLGATIVSEAWYPKGAADLKEQFSAIRRAAFIAQSEPMISFAGKLRTTDMMRLVELGVPRKRIDSLLSKAATVRAVDLLGLDGRRMVDSIGLTPAYDLTKLDSLQYPGTGIQAIYIPISDASEIGVAAAQFAYYNLQARLFGSGEWNDLPELHEHKRYCAGVTFESDSYVDTSRTDVREFIAGYAARFRQAPTRNVYYGYDAAMLVLSRIRAGATTRTAIARALAATRDYPALHARIGFTPGRVNGWLSILQYNDDIIRRVGEVQAE